VAIFFNAALDKRVRPAARCLVGRAPHCHWVIDNPGVSREHAVLLFEGAWKVRDLSSTNGTFIEGERVRDHAVLPDGAALRFGSGDNEWKLVDAGPPSARAVGRTGKVASSAASGLVLPHPGGGEAYVSYQDGAWVFEHEEQARPVTDGEVIHLADEEWALELTLGEPSPLDRTSVIGDTTRIEFQSSLDEEHIELEIRIGDESHVFSHRSHLYVLMLLARARLEDQARNAAPASEHGWLETRELAAMLKSTSEQVNIWIWRARQQIHKFDPEIAQKIVERRPSLGLLRLGYDGIAVRYA
jgi:hypothetical protein